MAVVLILGFFVLLPVVLIAQSTVVTGGWLAIVMTLMLALGLGALGGMLSSVLRAEKEGHSGHA